MGTAAACLKNCSNKFTNDKDFVIAISPRVNEQIQERKKSLKNLNSRKEEENSKNSKIISFEREFNLSLQNPLYSRYSDNFNRSFSLFKGDSKAVSLINKNIPIKNSSEENLNLFSNMSLDSFLKNEKKFYNKFGNSKICDAAFEIAFRNKLIISMKLENNILNIIHSEGLKVPFPEDDEKIEDLDYLNNCIEKIKMQFKGKLKITRFHVDSSPIDRVNSFVEKAFENENSDESIKFSSNNEKNNIYVGINFKRVKDENYLIYYLWAKYI